MPKYYIRYSVIGSLYIEADVSEEEAREIFKYEPSDISRIDWDSRTIVEIVEEE